MTSSHAEALPTTAAAEPVAAVAGPPLWARLAVAVAIGALAALAQWWRSRGGASGPEDLDFVLFGARHFLAGRDPYPLVGPGRAFEWPWGLYYPATVFLPLAPLTPLSDVAARTVFAGVSAALLAFGITRDGYGRLPLFLSGAYLAALLFRQFTPLVVAASLLPPIGGLLAMKPTIGLALATASRTTRQLAWTAGGGLALLLVSLAIQPHWPLAWLAVIRGNDGHFIAPVTRFGGVLVLLALTRWRRPEARLLVALACVPQTTTVIEALPLFLVTRTRREALYLACATHAVWMLAGLLADAHTFEANTLVSARLLVALCYLPCLLLVLRRPNEGEVPAPVERLVKRLGTSLGRTPRLVAGD